MLRHGDPRDEEERVYGDSRVQNQTYRMRLMAIAHPITHLRTPLTSAILIGIPGSSSETLPLDRQDSPESRADA